MDMLQRKRDGKRRFTRDANQHYTYPPDRDLTPGVIQDFIQHHTDKQRPRLVELLDYYLGDNTTILTEKRRKDDKQADHRAPHNFAEYVSQFIQGYMVGVPLKTTYDTDDQVNEMIKDINRINDADEHNSEMVLDQSIYGRAYELVYRNQSDETRFISLDVTEAFVIYDDTVERNPIAGVRYKVNQLDNTGRVEVYTDTQLRIYTSDNTTFSDLEEHSVDEHYFGGVPLIEYQNNKYRTGDYEKVLNLIDLYDASQSDTANYMTDTNDAYLMVKGNVDLDLKSVDKMKDSNILLLKGEMNSDGQHDNVDASYIYKQYDVQGSESYKTRIHNDILRLTNVPDLLDENFGGNQSGEALKMKLFGLEQRRATKERLFKRGLRRRYWLISNMSSTAAEGDFDPNDITITFTENLPRSIAQEMEWFAKLGGQLSEETLISQLSFVENPQEEMRRLERESPRRDAEYPEFGQADNDNGVNNNA